MKKQFSVIRNTRAYLIGRGIKTEFLTVIEQVFFINRYRRKFLPDAIKLGLIVLGDLPVGKKLSLTVNGRHNFITMPILII